jgi:hypothetical protein
MVSSPPFQWVHNNGRQVLYHEIAVLRRVQVGQVIRKRDS